MIGQAWAKKRECQATKMNFVQNLHKSWLSLQGIVSPLALFDTNTYVLQSHHGCRLRTKADAGFPSRDLQVKGRLSVGVTR